jgi:hypothetical protein
MSDDKTVIKGKDVQAARQARLDRITDSEWFRLAYMEPGESRDDPASEHYKPQRALLWRCALDHAEALIQIAEIVGCDSPAWPDIVLAVRDLQRRLDA